MTGMTLVYLLGSIILILLNGSFVLAEFALMKVRATRIEGLARAGNRRGAVDVSGFAIRRIHLDLASLHTSKDDSRTPPSSAI